MSSDRAGGRPQAPRIVIRRWSERGWEEQPDQLAAEEPLQLLLNGAPLSIVMRTPGRDVELALGLLWAERVITDREQVHQVRIGELRCSGNTIPLRYRQSVETSLQRHLAVRQKSATLMSCSRQHISARSGMCSRRNVKLPEKGCGWRDEDVRI